MPSKNGRISHQPAFSEAAEPRLLSSWSVGRGQSSRSTTITACLFLYMNPFSCQDVRRQISTRPCWVFFPSADVLPSQESIEGRADDRCSVLRAVIDSGFSTQEGMTNCFWWPYLWHFPHCGVQLPELVSNNVCRYMNPYEIEMKGQKRCKDIVKMLKRTWQDGANCFPWEAPAHCFLQTIKHFLRRWWSVLWESSEAERINKLWERNLCVVGLRLDGPKAAALQRSRS